MLLQPFLSLCQPARYELLRALGVDAEQSWVGFYGNGGFKYERGFLMMPVCGQHMRRRQGDVGQYALVRTQVAPDRFEALRTCTAQPGRGGDLNELPGFVFFQDATAQKKTGQFVDAVVVSKLPVCA